jgi:hypothetical protein
MSQHYIQYNGDKCSSGRVCDKHRQQNDLTIKELISFLFDSVPKYWDVSDIKKQNHTIRLQ